MDEGRIVVRSWQCLLKLEIFVSGSGLEKMELERLQIVDAIKGYRSKSVYWRAVGVKEFKEKSGHLN